MQPDKTTKCHRTSFKKTCHECVTEHGCRLWKRVELDFDPETGAKGFVKYDCIDSLMDIYSKDMLRRQFQTVAEVNAFRTEAKQANDQVIGSVFSEVNARINDHAALPPPPQKLIEN